MLLETTKKKEWLAWFKSPDAAQAIADLEATRLLAASNPTPDISTELARIKRTTKPHLSSDPCLGDFVDSLEIEDLQCHIASQTSILAQAVGEWDDKRNKGWRKGRTKAQNFVVAFDRFLKAFSGILEIAKLADEQYGGAASKIFAVLWATVKLKTDGDETIVSVMECINDRLPDVDIYNKVYVDTVLGRLIASAYRDVLLFSHQAAVYFQGRGISRMMHSVKRPFSFAEQQVQLVKIFTSIRVRCDALLAQRIASLSEQNAALLEQMQVMVKTQQAERVRKLQKALGRHHAGSKATLDDDLLEYRRFLQTMQATLPPEVAHMTARDLQALPEYQRWTSARSSLLFLHGRNDESWPVPQSWLSLAAVDLVEHIRASDTKSLVVFQRCSPEDTAQDVIKGLISQLLDLEPSVVKDADDMRDLELRLSVDEATPWSYGRDVDHNPLDDYSRVLTSIVDKCPRPVHLVVNRPELCMGGNLMWRFVKALLRSVQDTKVKVILVVRTELWDIESRLCDLDEAALSPDSCDLVVLRRHQYEFAGADRF